MGEVTSVQAVVRTLRILEVLNRQSVTSLHRLYTATQLPKSTLVRLLETLISAGFVARISRREGYAPTERVLRLSAGVRHRELIVDMARSHLEDFTRTHKWQVSIATSEGDTMLVRFTTRHMSPFAREEVFLNRRVGMLRSAMGQVYFAHCPADEAAFILKLLAASDPTQIGSHGGLVQVEKLAAKIRRDGYASRGSSLADATCGLAAPILEPGISGGPLAALVMTYYPSAMSEQEAIERYLPPIRAIAERIAVDFRQARNAEES